MISCWVKCYTNDKELQNNLKSWVSGQKHGKWNSVQISVKRLGEKPNQTKDPMSLWCWTQTWTSQLWERLIVLEIISLKKTLKCWLPKKGRANQKLSFSCYIRLCWLNVLCIVDSSGLFIKGHSDFRRV